MQKCIQSLYKYALVNTIVYISMSNAGDQHPDYVWHPALHDLKCLNKMIIPMKQRIRVALNHTQYHHSDTINERTVNCKTMITIQQSAVCIESQKREHNLN